jgi:hypothetical protein
MLIRRPLLSTKLNSQRSKPPDPFAAAMLALAFNMFRLIQIKRALRLQPYTAKLRS